MLVNKSLDILNLLLQIHIDHIQHLLHDTFQSRISLKIYVSQIFSIFIFISRPIRLYFHTRHRGKTHPIGWPKSAILSHLTTHLISCGSTEISCGSTKLSCRSTIPPTLTGMDCNSAPTGWIFSKLQTKI